MKSDVVKELCGSPTSPSIIRYPRVYNWQSISTSSSSVCALISRANSSLSPLLPSMTKFNWLLSDVNCHWLLWFHEEGLLERFSDLRYEIIPYIVQFSPLTWYWLLTCALLFQVSFLSARPYNLDKLGSAPLWDNAQIPNVEITLAFDLDLIYLALYIWKDKSYIINIFMTLFSL